MHFLGSQEAGLCRVVSQLLPDGCSPAARTSSRPTTLNLGDTTDPFENLSELRAVFLERPVLVYVPTNGCPQLISGRSEEICFPRNLVVAVESLTPRRVSVYVPRPRGKAAGARGCDAHGPPIGRGGCPCLLSGVPCYTRDVLYVTQWGPPPSVL